MNFQKIPLKWKFSKHFISPKQWAVWKELFTPSPHPPSPPNKSFLCLWEKKPNWDLQEYTENCFPSAVLERLEMVQHKCFFWHPTNMFLVVLLEYIFQNIGWVGVRKMSEVFECNCNFWITNRYWCCGEACSSKRNS